MSRISQDDVGRCDFIDVLEEAVTRGRPVAVQLREGEAFIDQLLDVLTENGDEFAVFRQHDRVSIGQISAVSRPELVRAP